MIKDYLLNTRNIWMYLYQKTGNLFFIKMASKLSYCYGKPDRPYDDGYFYVNLGPFWFGWLNGREVGCWDQITESRKSGKIIGKFRGLYFGYKKYEEIRFGRTRLVTLSELKEMMKGLKDD